MPDGGDADVFEIISSQLGQDLRVDLVLPERLLVALQPQLPHQGADQLRPGGPAPVGHAGPAESALTQRGAPHLRQQLSTRGLRFEKSAIEAFGPGPYLRRLLPPGRSERRSGFLRFLAGIKAFTAAVLGGIGNIMGAMIGGVLLGLGESLIVALVPALAQYRDDSALVILILGLLFTPTGIMGEALIEK